MKIPGVTKLDIFYVYKAMRDREASVDVISANSDQNTYGEEKHSPFKVSTGRSQTRRTRRKRAKPLKNVQSSKRRNFEFEEESASPTPDSSPNGNRSNDPLGNVYPYSLCDIPMQFSTSTPSNYRPPVNNQSSSQRHCCNASYEQAAQLLNSVSNHSDQNVQCPNCHSHVKMYPEVLCELPVLFSNPGAPNSAHQCPIHNNPPIEVPQPTLQSNLSMNNAPMQHQLTSTFTINGLQPDITIPGSISYIPYQLPIIAIPAPTANTSINITIGITQCPTIGGVQIAQTPVIPQAMGQFVLNPFNLLPMPQLAPETNMYEASLLSQAMSNHLPRDGDTESSPDTDDSSPDTEHSSPDTDDSSPLSDIVPSQERPIRFFLPPLTLQELNQLYASGNQQSTENESRYQ